jgi:hypothetical protein
MIMARRLQRGSRHVERSRHAKMDDQLGLIGIEPNTQELTAPCDSGDAPSSQPFRQVTGYQSPKPPLAHGNTRNTPPDHIAPQSLGNDFDLW